MKKVVVVGSGFAGVAVTKALCRCQHCTITLIDQKNYYLFQPLLYQVAMGALSPEDIAIPIRVLFSRFPHVQVLKETAVSVDLKSQKVTTDCSEIPYDYLVMACGARHSYFGHTEWEPFAPGLKTLEQALEIRNRVLEAFEKAETLDDEKLRKKLLTFVIVGGGPTGVELAGAIADISRLILTRNFRRIDPQKTRVILLEAAPRVLGYFSEDISKKALSDLEALGVEVRTSSALKSVGPDGVVAGDEKIEAGLVLWAAGVEASRLNQTLRMELDPQGRVTVEPDLSLKACPNIFVIGDQARCVDVKTGSPLPGVAAVAIQQGYWTGKNILRILRGSPSRKFQYHDHGKAATIGKSRAVVEIGKFKLTGFPAWIVWLFIHIWFLEGTENRLIVFLKWAWAYLGHYDAARIILAKEWRFFKGEKSQ